MSLCLCVMQNIIIVKDECFSDGELGLRRGSIIQANTGHKKITRRRNKVASCCHSYLLIYTISDLSCTL